MRGVEINCRWDAPPPGDHGQVSLCVELECGVLSDVDRMLECLRDGQERTTGVVSNRTGVEFRRVAAVLHHLDRRGVVIRHGFFWSAPALGRSSERIPTGRIRYTVG